MKVTPLDYRHRQPAVTVADVRPYVLAKPMRVINVIAGPLSAIAHAAFGMFLVLLILPRAAAGSADARTIKLFALLTLLAAASAVMLAVASFARRQRWILLWVAFEVLVSLGLCALVTTARGRGGDLGTFTLMRGMLGIGYALVVAWMSCPPERK